MKVYLRKQFVFIPTWNDNEDLPEDEQIKIHFQFLSGADIEDLMSGSKDGTLNSATAEAEWLKKCVKVENLELDGKAAKPIDIIKEGSLLPLWLESKLAYNKKSALGEETKKK